MNNLITLNNNTQFPVNGRELHESLQIETRYDMWFSRMVEYGFYEERDFCTKMCKSTGGRPATNHMLTIDMAKHLCMIQRSAIGMQIRQHLIEIENSWNTPEQIMARALAIANDTITQMQGTVISLKAFNAELTVQNQIMAPKADYFDELVERGVNINIRNTAKELGVKEQAFVQFLLNHKYLFRDQKGKLTPYAQYDNDLFVTKECFNEKTDWSGTQTLITPKGRETFRLLMDGLKTY